MLDRTARSFIANQTTAPDARSNVREMDYTDIPLEDCRTGDEGAMLLFAVIANNAFRNYASKR